jgi:hypothetical protein
MPSSSFTCVKTTDLDAIARAARAYAKMSNVKVVTQAAKKAGEHLKTAMQKTITGESSLLHYHNVSDALSVYESSGNVHVGLPESHALHGTALEMESVYPVTDVVTDLSRQQGDIEAKFYDALAEAVSA